MLITHICNLIKQFLSGFFSFLWSLFLNGFLTILPLIATIGFFHLSLKLLKNWLEPIRQWKPKAIEQFPLIEKVITFLFENIPYFEIIVAFIIILIVGIIVRVVLLKTIISGIEALLLKLPLIRPVYSGIKQLTAALDPQNELVFQKVVLFEFPRHGAYSIGFLTGEVPIGLAPNNTEKFFSVYVPTTPNPTSGFYIIMAEKDLTITNLTRQEATTIIISGGIIQPERFNSKNLSQNS